MGRLKPWQITVIYQNIYKESYNKIKIYNISPCTGYVVDLSELGNNIFIKHIINGSIKTNEQIPIIVSCGKEQHIYFSSECFHELSSQDNILFPETAKVFIALDPQNTAYKEINHNRPENEQVEKTINNLPTCIQQTYSCKEEELHIDNTSIFIANVKDLRDNNLFNEVVQKSISNNLKIQLPYEIIKLIELYTSIFSDNISNKMLLIDQAGHIQQQGKAQIISAQEIIINQDKIKGNSIKVDFSKAIIPHRVSDNALKAEKYTKFYAEKIFIAKQAEELINLVKKHNVLQILNNDYYHKSAWEIFFKYFHENITNTTESDEITEKFEKSKIKLVESFNEVPRESNFIKKIILDNGATVPVDSEVPKDYLTKFLKQNVDIIHDGCYLKESGQDESVESKVYFLGANDSDNNDNFEDIITE